MTKLLKAITGLILFAQFQMAESFASEAIPLVTQSDKAYIILEKHYLPDAGGYFDVTKVFSINPSIIQYKNDSIKCSYHQCTLQVILSKNNNTKIKNCDTSSILFDYPIISHGFKNIEINMDYWKFAPFHLATAITQPSKHINLRGMFSYATVNNKKLNETEDYIEIEVEVWLNQMSSDQPVEYQTIQFLASGILGS